MSSWPTILITLFLLQGCASNSKNSESEFSKGKENRPQWVNDPAEFCGDMKLCAVGEGISFLRAESEARKNLAKIFKVEVSGTTTINEETKSISTPGFLQSAGVSEEVEVLTREVVDDVLEGVITSKKHEEDGSVFALAELDKTIAMKLVRPRIKELDDEIEQLYESERRSLLPRAFDLDAKRSGLKSFVSVLGLPDFSRGVSRQDLLERKASYDKNPISVIIEGKGRWDAVTETVTSELISLGYNIVKKGPYNFKVVVENNAKREYLNVKGFERYHVNVKVSAISSNGDEVGGVAFEATENGRSLSQIRASILEDFRKHFYEQLPGLHLD